MPRYLIAKLEQFTRLSRADRAALREVTGRRRQVEAREDVVREGEGPGPVRLVLEGWACRYKQLEDGRRQIVAMLLPGDLCDTHLSVLREMDHSIGTYTPVTLAEIPRERLADLAAHHPRVGQALWWEMLVAAAIQREWTVNIGQRDAPERLGHLLCELYMRLHGIGLTQGEGYDLPLRQIDLAEAMGLTVVHTNRSLQCLRGRGLITLKGRRLAILDMEALQRVSLFEPAYLHADRVGAHLDANDDPGPATNTAGVRPS